MKTKHDINRKWREGTGKDYNKKYYLKNKEKILNRVKEYTIENNEYIKDYQKTYRLNNRNKINTTIRNYYIKYPWRKIWRGTLNNLQPLEKIKNLNKAAKYEQY